MNPLTNVRNIQKLNERMLEMGVEDSEAWHKQYKDSAYVFIGGLPYGLTEGDILCVFSQYGEIVNINLVRDKKTGKTKGFCFLCYEDQRSTILAVDNFNGIKLGGRTIRVDHCSNYRRPKGDEKDEHGNYKEIIEEGCAPKTPPQSDEEEEVLELPKKRKKEKKQKKQKKSKDKSEKKRKMSSSSDKEEGEKKQKLDLMRKELPRKQRGQDRIERDEPHDNKSHNYRGNRAYKAEQDHGFGGDHKGNRDVANNSRGSYEHLRGDHSYEHNYKSDSHERDRSSHSLNRHVSDDRRDQRGDAYLSSRGERDLEFDERRRDKANKQRDHRTDDRRSYKRHNRSDYNDRRDRR